MKAAKLSEQPEFTEQFKRDKDFLSQSLTTVNIIFQHPSKMILQFAMQRRKNGRNPR